MESEDGRPRRSSTSEIAPFAVACNGALRAAARSVLNRGSASFWSWHFMLLFFLLDLKSTSKRAINCLQFICAPLAALETDTEQLKSTLRTRTLCSQQCRFGELLSIDLVGAPKLLRMILMGQFETTSIRNHHCHKLVFVPLRVANLA